MDSKAWPRGKSTVKLLFCPNRCSLSFLWEESDCLWYCGHCWKCFGVPSAPGSPFHFFCPSAPPFPYLLVVPPLCCFLPLSKDSSSTKANLFYLLICINSFFQRCSACLYRYHVLPLSACCTASWLGLWDPDLKGYQSDLPIVFPVSDDNSSIFFSYICTI